MDNYSISSVPNQDAENTGQIEVKGELSIPYIREIKKKIESAIKPWSIIELRLSEVSIIDLSMLQYLFALKKSESFLGKKIRIYFDLDNETQELLNHAGFKHIEKLNE